MAKHKDHGSSMKMVDPTMAAVGAQPQMTYQPPMPANQMGMAKPVFSPQTQGMAQTIYGTPEQRQVSVGSGFMMESPLEGNEFTGALAKAKQSGAGTFEVDGKTYDVK
jgi:hypothetical protein